MVLRFFALILLLGALAPASAMPRVPDPPYFDVTSYVLMDMQSGRVIAGKRPDRPMAPGSLAKLMTLYIVFADLASGRIALTDRVSIGEDVWKIHGTQMFLLVGTAVSVRDLIRGVVVASANDASIALAQYVAGTANDFVRYMNRFAEALGMQDTHFTNPTGLADPGMLTTARDVATLARSLIRRFPRYYHFFDQETLTFNDITQRNRNMLLWRNQDVDGLKTGSDAEDGYHLAASAERDNGRLISVVMGASGNLGRAAATMGLLNYGFRFFETRKLYDAGSRLLEQRVWKGARETVPLGLIEPLYVTLPKGARDALKADVSIPARLLAPLPRGQRVGELVIRLDDTVLARAPVVTLAPVAPGSGWTRAIDTIVLYFKSQVRSWFPQIAKAIGDN